MAEPSRVTWGGWEPRVCLVCRLRVTLSQSAYHGGALERPFSVHAACGGFAAVFKLLDAITPGQLAIETALEPAQLSKKPV